MKTLDIILKFKLNQIKKTSASVKNFIFQRYNKFKYKNKMMRFNLQDIKMPQIILKVLKA